MLLEKLQTYINSSASIEFLCETTGEIIYFFLSKNIYKS